MAFHDLFEFKEWANRKEIKSPSFCYCRIKLAVNARFRFFFLHAGLLSRLYFRPSPFLLPPLKAFRLIPLGYISFLLMAFLLTWVMNKLEIVGKMRGLVFGFKFGGMVWGALVLGLVSISTADVALLLGWLFGQALELGIAGTVVGSGLSGERLKRLFVTVLIFTLISVIITVLYQNLVLIQLYAYSELCLHFNII